MGFLSTTAELLDDALTKSGEKIDGTSSFEADALKYMDTFYKTILAGGNMFNVDLAEPWSWAKAKFPGVLILEPAYATGTIAVTQDSTTGAFSTAPSVNLTGRYLKLSDRPEVYRIASHIAGQTAFTLDAPYADTTTSAISYKAIKLDYELDAATLIRQIGPMRVAKTQLSGKNDEGVIESMELSAFNREFSWRQIDQGIPTAFAIAYQTEGSVTVRFNKYVESKTRVDYDFIPVPTDLADSSTSIPLIPIEHRQVLSLATAHQLCVDKEDDKSDYYLKATKAQLSAMVNANRKKVSMTSKRRGQFYPRLGEVTSMKTPRSGD